MQSPSFTAMDGRTVEWRIIEVMISSTVQAEGWAGAAGQRAWSRGCTWLLLLCLMGARLLPGLAGGAWGPVCVNQREVYTP